MKHIGLGRKWDYTFDAHAVMNSKFPPAPTSRIQTVSPSSSGAEYPQASWGAAKQRKGGDSCLSLTMPSPSTAQMKTCVVVRP
mmetsp:Transcript_32936/g.63553  ORF Transcript_32936/g.63553 Transcript_32936/m.63553 type:complete len:83 (+) Transcript_32936:743-991(+)